MAKYIDGFVLPIPTKNLKTYTKIAKLCSKVWLDHGALEYLECVAEDIKPGTVTSFPLSVKLKKSETVVFSYITYKSRKHRDTVLKKVFTDPRLKFMMNDSSKIFDMQRMIYGGFKTIVEAKKK